MGSIARGALRAGERRRPSSPAGVRRGWLFIVALLLQFAAAYGDALGMSGALQVATFQASYALLLAGVLGNLHLWGFRVLLVGLLLNLLAIVANGWRMPVSPETLVHAGRLEDAALPSGTHLDGSKSVLLTGAETNFRFLTDILVSPPPLRRIFSIGDAVIAMGVVVALAQLVARWLRPNAAGRAKEA